MTDSLLGEVAQMMLARAQRRADDTKAFLESLPARELWLIREAAVMGFVLGDRHGRVTAREPLGEAFPKDLEIVGQVISHCRSTSDLYPLLGGSVHDLVRRLVRENQPVASPRVAEAVTVLTTMCLDEAEAVIVGLVNDETLIDGPDGLRESS